MRRPRGGGASLIKKSSSATSPGGAQADSHQAASPQAVAPHRPYVWGLTLRDAIFLSFLGAVIPVFKLLFRVDLHVPGHTGLVWIAVMIVGRALVPRRYAATWVGTVAGLLAALMGQGKEGPLVFFQYLFPGLTIDLLVRLFGERWSSYLAVGLYGAVAHLTKLVAIYVAGRILGVPQYFLTLGLGLSAASHALFGFLGGCLAVAVHRQLRGGGPDRKKMFSQAQSGRKKE